MKYCSKCTTIKEVSLFCKTKTNKDGLDHWCKSCKRNKYLQNRDHYLTNAKLYYQENKEEVHRYQRQKRKSDPIFKLANNVRRRINHILTKSKKTKDYLGCTFEQLAGHLESQFNDGMTWENYGSFWHVDHIKALGNAKSEKEVYELCHYTNLQPLEAIENIRKGKR